MADGKLRIHFLDIIFFLFLPTMVKALTNFIDYFYFIFKRFMPLKTYRYAVCGGGNLLLDIVLYIIFYHFVFDKVNVDAGIMVFTPHIAALFAVFPITLTTGFLLNKYITFQDSNLKGKVQFVRYFAVALGAISLSYVLMKMFVDGFGFYPTPSRILTIFISVIYSYILQSRFSFKVKNEKIELVEIVETELEETESVGM